MCTIISRLFNCVFALTGMLLLHSCSTYNFSHPLPLDKPNIYVFPLSWQGRWIDADSQQLIIGNNSAAVVMQDVDMVVKGIWPKKNEKGQYIYPGGVGYRSMYSITWDSLGNPKDTVANYIINENHIYEINGDRRLEKGFHFTTDNDTLMVIKDDTIWVDLGHNAFLRELKKDFYVLNILDQEIGRDSRWWQVILLEKTGADKIDRWECSYNLTRDSSMFYSVHDDYYFNSTWKAAAMIKLVSDGVFEKCNPLSRVQ